MYVVSRMVAVDCYAVIHCVRWSLFYLGSRTSGYVMRLGSTSLVNVSSVA